MSDSPAAILFDTSGVEKGTDTNPVRVDPTGDTDQPVTVASLPLPAGAATEASLTAASAKIPATLGQKAMTASMAVAVASDQSAIPTTVASLPLPSGAATETTVDAINDKLPAALGQTTKTGSLAVTIASDQDALAVTAAALPLPSGAATEATLSAASAKLPASLGQKTMANSMSVAVASDQGTLPVKETRASTAAVTSVSAAVADTSLLAGNSNRLGAAVFNDSTASLYLKLGTGASTTSFTILLNRYDYYEIPWPYTGAVNGYWSSATGSARVTELS
jgi:hypothetical protein